MTSVTLGDKRQGHDMDSVAAYRRAVHLAGAGGVGDGDGGGSEPGGLRHRHPAGPAPKGAPRARRTSSTLEHGVAQQRAGRATASRAGASSMSAASSAQYLFTDPGQGAAHGQGGGSGGGSEKAPNAIGGGGGGSTVRKDMPSEEKSRAPAPSETRLNPNLNSKPLGFIERTTSSNASSFAATGAGVREVEGAGAGGGRQGPHRSYIDGAGGGGVTKETKSLSAGGMGSGLSMGLMSMGVPWGVPLGVPLGGVKGGPLSSAPFATGNAAAGAATPRNNGGTPREGTREKPLAMLARYVCREIVCLSLPYMCVYA
jgi:hypothetical protein